VTCTIPIPFDFFLFVYSHFYLDVQFWKFCLHVKSLDFGKVPKTLILSLRRCLWGVLSFVEKLMEKLGTRFLIKYVAPGVIIYFISHHTISQFLVCLIQPKLYKENPPKPYSISMQYFTLNSKISALFPNFYQMQKN